MNKSVECSPSPYCRCCECQGIKCFMDHPGHSHIIPVINRLPDLLIPRKA